MLAPPSSATTTSARGVNRLHHYEPEINIKYQEMAVYSGAAVILKGHSGTRPKNPDIVIQPEQVLSGIIRFGPRPYDAERMEAACHRALLARAPFYRTSGSS